VFIKEFAPSCRLRSFGYCPLEAIRGTLAVVSDLPVLRWTPAMRIVADPYSPAAMADAMRLLDAPENRETRAQLKHGQRRSGQFAFGTFARQWSAFLHGSARSVARRIQTPAPTLAPALADG
jgi:hypothetical protein